MSFMMLIARSYGSYVHSHHGANISEVGTTKRRLKEHETRNAARPWVGASAIDAQIGLRVRKSRGIRACSGRVDAQRDIIDFHRERIGLARTVAKRDEARRHIRRHAQVEVAIAAA